ncbi:hypothetical protein B0T24DRAFT_605632 [Lasiosphaeria ovina]|uniref:Uncharacterized protein n=1 Tax=Lasiosphaeria ovina TaxID=92902 RepID=A0AAE0TY04_9PEZI|nr:hypothetical protein B0T24DRAFT_605632 [Lasiosphaeria ovina]
MVSLKAPSTLQWLRKYLGSLFLFSHLVVPGPEGSTSGRFGHAFASGSLKFCRGRVCLAPRTTDGSLQRRKSPQSSATACHGRKCISASTVVMPLLSPGICQSQAWAR